MYIKSFDYGGMDWHDSRLVVKQLQWNQSYDIPKEQQWNCICADIMKRHPYADPKKVLKAVKEEGVYIFPIREEKDGKWISVDMPTPEEIWLPKGTGKEIMYDNQVLVAGCKLYEEYSGGFSYTVEYKTEEIASGDVCFLPEEQFYAWSKGVPLVERCFHEIFHDLSEAETFMQTMEKHIPDSEVEMLVHAKSEITQSEWYKLNMEALRLMRELADKTDSFRVCAEDHIQALSARSMIS